MLGIAEKVWAFFTAPDLQPVVEETEFQNPQQARTVGRFVRSFDMWGVKISMTFLAITIFAVWATTLGFVRAGDVDAKVKSEVKAAVAELETRQNEIRDDVALIKEQNWRMEGALNEILKSTTATSICRILARRQRETDQAERAALRLDIDEEQAKYRTAAGEYYPESRCGGN